VHSLSRLCTSIHPLRLLSAFIPSVHHVHLDPSIAPLYLLRYSMAAFSFPCRHSGQTPHCPRQTLRPTDRNTLGPSCILCRASATSPIHPLCAYFVESLHLIPLALAYFVESLPSSLCLTCTLPLCVYPSLCCMDFVIVQLLPTSTIDIQDNPTTVHVGHYGQPTVTPLLHVCSFLLVRLPLPGSFMILSFMIYTVFRFATIV
jgi:hypothetical protein